MIVRSPAAGVTAASFALPAEMPKATHSRTCMRSESTKSSWQSSKLKTLLASALVAVPLALTSSLADAGTYQFQVDFTQIEGEGPSDDTNGEIAKPGTLLPGDLTGYFTFDVFGGTETLRFQIFDALTAMDFIFDTGAMALTGGTFDDDKWEVKSGDGDFALPAFIGPNGAFPENTLEFKIEGSGFPMAGLPGGFGNITKSEVKWEAKGLDENILGYLCGPNAKDGVPNCNGKLTPKAGAVALSSGPPAVVPLPPAGILLGAALLGAGAFGRRRKKA